MTNAAILELGKTKLNKAEAEAVADIMQGACVKTYVYRSAGELNGVIIDLWGKVAHFPSKGNIERSYKNKRRNDMKVRLYALTSLYTASLLEQDGGLPHFDETPVHVALYCARHKVRFDTHNQCKALGDWLEVVGLIDNDAAAQIHAYRKSDYLRHFPDQFSSTIVIQRLDKIRSLLGETIRESINVAIGNLELIG